MVGTPKVGANQDGRLEVVVRGPDGLIYHIEQVAPDGAWTSWTVFKSTGQPSFRQGKAGLLARGALL